jgi:hypothetical protein
LRSGLVSAWLQLLNRLRTASLLGLTIPLALQVAADEVDRVIRHRDFVTMVGGFHSRACAAQSEPCPISPGAVSCFDG